MQRNRQKNRTMEECANSIDNLCAEWNISRQHDLKVFTHVIGIQIKKLRIARGITQTRLAKIVGVTFQQIQKYERGQNLCNPFNLLIMAEYFEIGISFFIQPFLMKNLKILKDFDNSNVYPFRKDRNIVN